MVIAPLPLKRHSVFRVRKQEGCGFLFTGSEVLWEQSAITLGWKPGKTFPNPACGEGRSVCVCLPARPPARSDQLISCILHSQWDLMASCHQSASKVQHGPGLCSSSGHLVPLVCIQTYCTSRTQRKAKMLSDNTCHQYRDVCSQKVSFVLQFGEDCRTHQYPPSGVT